MFKLDHISLVTMQALDLTVSVAVLYILCFGWW